jgi:hypothetical protein
MRDRSSWRALFDRDGVRAFATIAGLFVACRAALFAVVYTSRYVIPERSPNWNKDYVAFPGSKLWDSFARWDSGWYNRIARDGYYLEGSQSDVAFFPAYPYLSRWLGAVFGSHWAAGLVLSNVALLFGLFFLYGTARRYLDRQGAERAVLFALVFPSSIFFSCFYTEGLFFFAVAGAFYFYERDRLLPAALFGALAVLTRSTGVLLFPAFTLGALHRERYRLRPLGLRPLFLLLIPAALLVFMLMLKEQVGDPFAFVKAQAGWGRGSASPITAIYEEAKRILPMNERPNAESLFLVIDMGATLGLFAVAAFALTRLDAAHAVFALLSVVVPLASGRVLSMERFAACVVPMYLVVAMVTARPSRERAVTAAFALSLALHAVFFANWYWAG